MVIFGHWYSPQNLVEYSANSLFVTSLFKLIRQYGLHTTIVKTLCRTKSIFYILYSSFHS